jgi:hypothetical protein
MEESKPRTSRSNDSAAPPTDICLSMDMRTMRIHHNQIRVPPAYRNINEHIRLHTVCGMRGTYGAHTVTLMSTYGRIRYAVCGGTYGAHTVTSMSTYGRIRDAACGAHTARIPHGI